METHAEVGDEQAEAASRDGRSRYLGDLVRERLDRRSLLKGAGLMGVGLVAVPSVLQPDPAVADPSPGSRIQFTPIPASTADAVLVAPNYEHNVVIRWGDPIFSGAPAFDVNGQTAAAQEQQFGYNCDYLAFMPLPAWLSRLGEAVGPHVLDLVGRYFARLRGESSRRALLWVNHEYTTGSDMFPGYVAGSPTAEQVNIELAAHGGSLVEIQRDADGSWSYVQDSPFNRRVTAETSISIDGPLAGHAYLQTGADPSGRTVKGMLNNCGGGKTPWGTVLTAEENFDQYFSNFSSLDAEHAARYRRTPGPAGASGRRWENFHPRFDLSKEPNEYARFGYIVEIDPYDPQSRLVKHTALGRLAHEAAVTVLSGRDHAVVYTGDDARFEYMYKFISRGRFDFRNRRRNLRLLEEGTLYVAKLEADGTGEWIPLTPSTPGLAGWTIQDILVNTRGAADLVRATRMDRPEDMDVSPTTGKVYLALTNNTSRTAVAADPAEVAANPRLGNRWGHILEIEEQGGDAGALSFQWGILMLCGDPAIVAHGTYFAGFDPSKVSKIACPDNVAFDEKGNLYIATDGQPSALSVNDGVFAVPLEGADRGWCRQFLSAPPRAEVCGPEFSGDNRTFFCAIQHPGEDRGLPNTASTWPDGTSSPVKPSVIAVFHQEHRKIGLA